MDIKKFIESQQDLDPEFVDIVNEMFWDMIGNEPTKVRVKVKKVTEYTSTIIIE